MLLNRRLCVAVAVALTLGLEGCGSRSSLRSTSGGDAGATPDSGAACSTDVECSSDPCQEFSCVGQRCVPVRAKNCDDGDECTEDSCEPESGDCTHRALALDQDGDGFRGPRPGYLPGAVSSCGNDCDDTRPAARPGGSETCDGVDNDCDGVVDENYLYEPVEELPLLVSSGPYQQARRGGFAHDGRRFAAMYTGRDQRWTAYLKTFGSDGSDGVPETPVTNVNNDSFAGGLVWNGAVYGTAWEDRRDGDYEVYFNRFDDLGNKLAPDLRVTNAEGFSLDPELSWNGLEFVVIWTDRRDDQPRLFAQRISVDGQLVGGNVALTDAIEEAEAPAIATSPTRIGVAYTNGSGEVRFTTVSHDLTSVAVPVTVSTTPALAPVIAWSRDRFVTAWEQYEGRPGRAIFGAVLRDDASVIVPERQLTFGNSVARSPALFPLGDRLVLAWAEQASWNFDIYHSIIDADLSMPGAGAELVSGNDDAINPTLTTSPDGALGVLFESHASGAWKVYFSRLDCASVGVE